MAASNGNYTGFKDQPQTTVSNGGTTAPAQGTSEQWTVSSSASFPPASLNSYPMANQWFKVADTASTSEIIAVTAVTGTVWGVTRGAEATTPVTHASNFTVQQVVTSEDLSSMVQLQSNGATVATTVNTTTLTTIATYTPMPPDIPAAGVVYDFHAYGTFVSATAATAHFTIATQWNGTNIMQVVSNTTGSGGTVTTSPTVNQFWIEGRVDCWGATTMVGGMNFQGANTGATHTISTMVGASTAGVTISGTAGPLTLLASTGTGMTLTTFGGSFFRIS